MERTRFQTIQNKRAFIDVKKMADLEFEEFRDTIVDLPQDLGGLNHSYKLVHGITPLEENKSFLEQVEIGEILCGIEKNGSMVSSWCEDAKTSPITESSLSWRDPKENPGDEMVGQYHWSTSDSEDNEEDNFINQVPPIQWQKQQETKSQRKRSRLLPSFTRCSLSESDFKETKSRNESKKHHKHSSKKKDKKGEALPGPNTSMSRNLCFHENPHFFSKFMAICGHWKMDIFFSVFTDDSSSKSKHKVKSKANGAKGKKGSKPKSLFSELTEATAGVDNPQLELPIVSPLSSMVLDPPKDSCGFPLTTKGKLS